MTDFKYIKEVASVVRKQTFYVESNLTSPLDNGESGSPFNIYGKSYARYKFVAINENKKCATANIKVDEMIALIEKSRICYRKATEELMFGSNSNNAADTKLSIAYTVKYPHGSYKGKSPAQVLLEEGREALEKNKKFLLVNVSKFPNNQKIIDAIDDALVLDDLGQLSAESANSVKQNVNSATLYSAEMRPLVRKVREDGKTFIYEVSVKWELGNNYPVVIRVRNYYAPVEKLPDGRLNVKKSEYDKNSLIDNSFAMSADEWLNVIYRIDANMKQFEMLQAKSIFERVRNVEIEAKREAVTARA